MTKRRGRLLRNCNEAPHKLGVFLHAHRDSGMHERSSYKTGGGGVKRISKSEILDALGAVITLRVKYNMEDTVERWVREESAPKQLHDYLEHASKSDFLDMWTTGPKERDALRKRIDRAQKGQHRASPVKAKVLDDIYLFIKHNVAWPDTRDLEYEQGSSCYVVASEMISEAKEVFGRSVK